MSKILLILGSGRGLGEATAKRFTAAGYKVATASRTVQPLTSDPETNDDRLHFTVDLSDPTAVEPIFNKVQESWGAPSVVVYNAYANIRDPNGPFASSISITAFANALNVNTVSLFAAATIAQSKNPAVTFLYTGNACNVEPLPGLSVLGVGKTASAHLIDAAAGAETRSGGSAKFYYCDQRDSQGGPMWNGVEPESHAELFLQLAEKGDQGDPIVVFNS